MRLLLASLVLVSHAPEMADGNQSHEPLMRVFHNLSFGELAVDGFFLLSGYLIVQSWRRDPRVRIFMQKRILRIYPGFVVASLLSAFVFGPLGSQPRTYFSQFPWAHYLFSTVFLLAPATSDTFTGLAYPVVNGAMWTIAYEFRCYLLVVLVGLLWKNRERIWPTIFLLSTLVEFVPVHYYRPLASLHLLTLFQCDLHQSARLLSYFSAGACFTCTVKTSSLRNPQAGWATVVVLLSLSRTGLINLVLPTFGAYVFFYVGLKWRTIVWKKSWPDLSYGAYLYGWPWQTLLLYCFPQQNCWLLLLASLPFIYASAALSWYVVEKPMLRMKPF